MSLQLLNGLRYIKFLLGCDSLVADIVVLIDESNRVRSVMYKLQKDFVNHVLNQLPVSKNMTHVGIIRFSDFNRTKVVSPLGNVTDLKLLNDIIMNISENETRGSGSHHKDAMKLSLKEMEERGRAGVRKIILFCTGSPPSHGQSARDIAETARDQGYDIFGIAFDWDLRDELYDIVYYKTRVVLYSPHYYDYLYHRDYYFHRRSHYVDYIANVICNNNGKCIIEMHSGTLSKKFYFIVVTELLNTTGITVVRENGQNVSFNCTADGVPVPTIVWRKNGQLVMSRNKWSIFSTNVTIGFRRKQLPGVLQITSTLAITDLTESDNGNYSCRAENEFDDGVVLATPYILTVECKYKLQTCYYYMFC